MSHADAGTSSRREIATRLGALRVREVGTGPPALLWHSLFVDSTTWQRVEGRLGAARRLIVIDGPGHGSSGDAGRDYTLNDCAGAASDVLDELGITGPVDWLGNAWGGHVGVVFAVSERNRCRSMTAVCAPVHALEPAVRRQMRASIPAYRLLGPIPPFVKALTHGGLLSPHPHPDDVRVVADAFRRADRRGMARAMSCISLRRADLTQTLPAVTVPTLMISAAEDPLWRPEQARAAVRAMPLATSITVPGGGHVEPLLRSAQLLAGIITEFWRDPPSFVGHREAPATGEPRLD